MTTDGTNAANSGTEPPERPFSLVIGVTSSPAERLRLTELLDGVAPLLMVADLDELRELITADAPDPAGAPGPPVPEPRSPRRTAPW